MELERFDLDFGKSTSLLDALLFEPLGPIFCVLARRQRQGRQRSRRPLLRRRGWKGEATAQKERRKGQTPTKPRWSLASIDLYMGHTRPGGMAEPLSHIEVKLTILSHHARLGLSIAMNLSTSLSNSRNRSVLPLAKSSRNLITPSHMAFELVLAAG